MFMYEFLGGHMFSFILGTYLRAHLLGHIKLLNHTVTLSINTWGIAKLFLQSGCNILYSYQLCLTIPISQHIFQYLILSVFYYCHPSGYEVIIAHYGFDLHFTASQWCWASLHVLVSHLYISFTELSIWILFPLLSWVLLFIGFLVEVFLSAL